MKKYLPNLFCLITFENENGITPEYFINILEEFEQQKKFKFKQN